MNPVALLMFKLSKSKKINKDTRNIIFKIYSTLFNIIVFDKTKLIDIALDKDMCTSAREFACEKYKSVCEKYKFWDKKNKLSKIEEYLNKKELLNSDLIELEREVPGNYITNQICSKRYPNSVREYLKDMPDNDTFALIYEIKKGTYDMVDTFEYLTKNNNKDLYNKIINIELENAYDIGAIIREYNISNKIKIDIIKRYINKDNINSVLRYCYSKEHINLILKEKENILNEIISGLDIKELTRLIEDRGISRTLCKKLNDERQDLLLKAIDKISPDCYLYYFTSYKIDTIQKIIIENKYNELINYIKTERFSRIDDILSDDENKYNLKQLIIKYREKDVIEYIKSANEYKISNIINNQDDLLFDYVLKYRFDSIKNKYTNLKDFDLTIQLRKAQSFKLKKLIINENITDDNIIEKINSIFRYSCYTYDVIKTIIDVKRDVLYEIISKYTFDELLHLYKFDNAVKSIVFNAFTSYIKTRIINENLNHEEKTNIIFNNQYEKEIRNIILLSDGFKEEDLNSFYELYTCFPYEYIYYDFYKIKDFVVKNNINFEAFIQYGIGNSKYNDWLINIVEIFDNNKEEEFYKIKEYFFNNYYEIDSNQIKSISNFLDILKNYSINYNICKKFYDNNYKFNYEDKINLSKIFNMDSCIEEFDINKLSDIVNNDFNKDIESIINDKLDIDELKDLYNKYIFNNCENLIKNINGTEGLIRLKHMNNNSEFNKLVDTLIPYTSLFEIINNSNNKESLRKSLIYIYNNNLFNKLNNIYYKLEDTIREIYEIDSMLNLTDLSKCNNMINKELSDKYGVPCYDFMDKNYCLYGHVLSHKENISDLMKGKSTSKSNFISVSAISYLGQKYYYDYGERILAFNKLNSCSFICSSMMNLASNKAIKNNSSEVDTESFTVKQQRGILETSSGNIVNSEALLYREGLVPCGLVLPGGRVPTKRELDIAREYNLPFILTQEANHSINDVDICIPKNNFKYAGVIDCQELNNIADFFINSKNISDEYTGREIALFTDTHSLYEPTLAILEDIRKKGINEIYSLGDNIGLGPNPSEVFDLLEYYKVESILGNSEYYSILGTEPFNYLSDERILGQKWTDEKLGKERINKMKLWPVSKDLIIGNKKVGLCHFANDIRWDLSNSTWSYQNNFKEGVNSNQFRYTNSNNAINYMNNVLIKNPTLEELKGIKDALNRPIFDGKMVTDYDSILQGHVHFDMKDHLDNTDIYTLRASGVGYKTDPRDTACYYILKERIDGGFDIERVLVCFNKELLISNINSSKIPDKSFLKKML